MSGVAGHGLTRAAVAAMMACGLAGRRVLRTPYPPALFTTSTQEGG